MSTPAAKRRRIEAASQTLSKPFRSPFKSPLKVQAADDTSDGTIVTPKVAFRDSKPLISNAAAPPIFQRTSTRISVVNSCTKQKTFSSPLATVALNADPDLALLLRAQRDLEKQLRDVREALEVAEQARKIEVESRETYASGSPDAELVDLFEKWKGASRSAAEELFGKVRDRVNRMGGPRAWKEMQKKQQEYRSGWEQEVHTNNNDNNNGDDEGDKGDVEKQDLYAQYDIDPETENEKSQRVTGAGDTGEMPGQEDEFTMAMMLRTLNIDLQIIGYDREQQRWID